MVTLLPIPTLLSSEQRPQSLGELLSFPQEQLGQLDIAEVNLLCAEGLPGTEIVDRALCINAINQMAERVCVKTANGLNNFDRTPERWNHSLNIFLIHVMVSTLQLEFGVRYNPAKMPIDVPMDTADSFIFGIIQGQGGTCGSLPVLYAAVGRRLGYPLKLVTAACTNRWMHQFVRWDDPVGERFNIQVNNEGFSCPPDDYYRDGNYGSSQ